MERTKPLLRTMAGVALAWFALDSAALAQAKREAPLLVTQVPARVQGPPPTWKAGDLVRSSGYDGARVIVLSPGGEQRVLSEGFQSACDPNVSFDGQRVLFAGRKSGDTRWRIWEIGIDGKGLRPISPEHLDARNGIYVSTLNTLESPQPWPTVVFVARQAITTETGAAMGSALFDVKLDGTELRQVTYNPNHNLDPFQMWDGRVIYAAERHPSEPGVGSGRVGLYAVHIEGADMESYGGGKGQRIQQMPCVTENHLVVFVESNQPSADGAGQLGSVEARRPHVTYKPLTSDPAYVFLHPSPLRGNQVLVSRRSAAGKDTAGIFVFDADTGRAELAFDTPDFHEVQAVVVAPRKQPDGHSTVVTTTHDFGTFYGLNCYTTDAARHGQMKPGSVKRVRFIEGMTRPASTPAAPDADQPPFVARRLVGEAPVEEDGSFNVIVPANTPLLLQTLDERGMALGNCGWIWVKPKEVRGCIGCHEDPELVPENDFVQGLRRPSTPLNVPVEQRRTVTFRKDIAPLLQTHCATADCHGGHDTGLHLPLSAKPTERELVESYQTLTAPSATSPDKTPNWPAAGAYVDPGRARTSRLVWQVVGTDTSRPWDKHPGSSGARARKVSRMPPAGEGEPLTDQELRTFIEWIDLGAQFDAPDTSAMTVPKTQEAK